MSNCLRILALATLILLGMRPAPTAFAHAEYDSSVPAADSIVKTAPAIVTVMFTEGVKSSGSSLKVIDSKKATVDLGNSKVDTTDPDRKTMTVGLKPNLPAGKYTVQWTTISADDGEKDSDEFIFTVDPNAPGSSTSSTSGQSTTTAVPTLAATLAPAASPVAAPAPAAPPAPVTVPVPVAQPAPTAAPATAAAPAQQPATLPRTGEETTLPLLLLLGAVLAVVGVASRWSARLR